MHGGAIGEQIFHEEIAVFFDEKKHLPMDTFHEKERPTAVAPNIDFH